MTPEEKEAEAIFLFNLELDVSRTPVFMFTEEELLTAKTNDKK